MSADRPNNADAADCAHDRAPDTTTAGGWIRADQQSPDDGRTVLVACCHNSEPVWLGYHDDGRWLSIDGMDIDDVTHWQDLPDPPIPEGTP